MRSKIIIALLVIVCFTCLFSCNKEDDNGGGEALGVYVTLHNDTTVNGQTFGGYTGNSVTVPQKAGNTFLGYYTADGVPYFDGTGKQISGLMVADGMQFFAKYEQYKYTLKLHSQTGKFDDGTTERTVNVYYGEDLSEKIPEVYNTSLTDILTIRAQKDIQTVLRQALIF